MRGINTLLVVYLFCTTALAREFVISDNDANIDDVFATWVLFQEPSDELLANIITNADCMGYQTMDELEPKFHAYANMTDVPFAMSKVRGKEAFPWVYRGYSAAMGRVDCLKSVAGVKSTYKDGDLLYKDTLHYALASGKQVTIVATGPLTALAKVLKENPSFKKAIKRLIFMGGALDSCPGNIDPNMVSDFVVGTQAEWNVFWDPEAVDYIFQNTNFPITLIPVNLTNYSGLTYELMLDLQSQAKLGFPLSVLAFQSYSLVSDLVNGTKTSYFLWDVTAAIYKTRPQFFSKPVNKTLSVHVNGKEQGSLYEDPEGRNVTAILDFADADGKAQFYAYFLTTLRR